MAVSNITPELRSAKEKFLYFQNLRSCERVFSDRFFFALKFLKVPRFFSFSQCHHDWQSVMSGTISVLQIIPVYGLKEIVL